MYEHMAERDCDGSGEVLAELVAEKKKSELKNSIVRIRPATKADGSQTKVGG